MSATAAIVAKAQELIRAHTAIREGIQAQEGDWRHQLVRQRRTLAQLVGELGGLLAPELGRQAASPGLRALGDSFSDLRSRLAHHQASWPAVTLDERTEDYLTSADTVRAAFVTFTSRVNDLAQDTAR